MITDCKAPDDGCCELCGLPQNTRDLIEAMKEGVAIRIAGLEAEVKRLQAIVDTLLASLTNPVLSRMPRHTRLRVICLLWPECTREAAGENPRPAPNRP